MEVASASFRYEGDVSHARIIVWPGESRAAASSVEAVL